MQAPEKISGPNEVIIVWIPGHHEIPENEEGDKFIKVYVGKATGSPFAVDKEVIKCHLRQECLNSGKNCEVLCQSRQ
jgi:hypothetical protein